jgi:lysozyme
MRTNEAGRALIKAAETLQLRAYADPGSPRAKHKRAIGFDDRRLSGEPWTIGYGHTGGVKEGDVITVAQAEALFDEDLARFERDVTTLLGNFPVTENEFSALVSFAYNCGSDMDHDGKAEGLGDSALLRKLLAGDRKGAAAEFEKWIRSGGVVMPGLVKRRKAERELFERRP